MTLPRWRRRRLLAAGGLGSLGMLACSTLPLPAQAPPATSPAAALPPDFGLVAAPVAPSGDLPPPEPREFRGAWVATVANIDWPSRPGLPAALLKREALAILDRAQALRLNALILQVRPACDAIYPSALEPWTEYLSGEQGRAPWGGGEAAWDPLAFWVEEAHRRAIELHAWFNPYRARHSAARSPLVAQHIAWRRPELAHKVGDQLWLDPGQSDAANHTLAVVADVVRRYDIDAVHIDDYFYPYPVTEGGVELPFPDDVAWTRYKLDGGPIVTRDDWRRAQVNELVQAMQRTVQSIKPWVRFGISPFGLPRPDRRPAGVVGFSQFDKLYADVETWLANGWLDYLAPQLYWPIDRAGQPFPVLLDAWLAGNPQQRHVWPGLFTSRVINRDNKGEVFGTNVWPAQELVDQIALQRSRGAAAGGHIHFSMAALMQNRDGLATQLQSGAYAEPALLPATPWRQDIALAAPVLQAHGSTLLLQPGLGAAARHWAVWLRQQGRWHLQLLPGSVTQIDAAGADRAVASAVNRIGQTSPRTALPLLLP